MLRIYTYARCDACRKAVTFLRAHRLPFEEIPIRENPPTKGELRAMLAAHDGQLRKLFNTSGTDYRALGLSAKLPAMSRDEALDQLAVNGNLVKRPFATGGGTHLVGFDETRWRAALFPA